MSWSEAKLSSLTAGCRLVSIAAVAAMSLSLAGCGNGGFQPLYGAGASAAQREAIASVDFATIPGRVGQRIRNELVFERNSSTDGGVRPTKRFEVKVTESILTQFVTQTGNSTGQVYQVEASYRLINIATSKVEYEGRSLGRANFERFESVYSNVRAREDAENRAASVIANDIRTRLTAHLSRG